MFCTAFGGEQQLLAVADYRAGICTKSKRGEQIIFQFRYGIQHVESEFER